MAVTDYNIELRDRNGNLKQYLTPFVSKVSWEWNRFGGCGRCSITLQKKYREIEFESRDDIQIRVKSGTTSKLVYRGYISNIVPTMKIGQNVVLDVRGYFDLFKKIIVHTSGDIRTYSGQTVGAIVDDIADTFIVPKSPVTIAGAITAGSYLIDRIEFLDTVDSALSTLAELQGDVEYGVNENLVFYWVTESEIVTQRFFVGDNISSFERRINYDDIVNKIYFVGGDVSGSKYKSTGEAIDSQAIYGVAEKIINNSSITTDGVAYQYMSAILFTDSSPKINIRAKVLNTALRLEDSVPIGLVTFYDEYYDNVIIAGDIIGESGDGGSDITIGETADGGTGKIIGGQYSGQIDRISYELSNTPGRFNIDIQLGDTILETSAKLKRIESTLASLTQYQEAVWRHHIQEQ